MFNSCDGLQNRKLMFVKGSNGTVHLLSNEVSYRWLKLHYPSYKFPRIYISRFMESNVECFDCTGLGLTGIELNDIEI